MNAEGFREALLSVMDRKQHWAWPSFAEGLVEKRLLHVHLEQEYAVYVRDFPVLVGRAYVQCPIPAVRRELAENLYEEETGGLHAGRPHPDLFLEYPKGLGFDVSRFDHVQLLPEARAYRALLDDTTWTRGWSVAAAVVTIFIEGTSFERSLFDSQAPQKPEPPLEEHPLVKHYGLPLASLALTKAHRGVEKEHRLAAWRVMLEHVPTDDRERVVGAMEQTLRAWLAFRDDVAVACGLSKPRG
jgi:pyrroloquinoline-quinone synthase